MIPLQALIVLEDGFTLSGECFSGQGEVFGEIVFNTSMTGYQEMITDPSYKGQILTLTYPLIGNYGVNEYDSESAFPQVEGLLVKEYCQIPRNRRSIKSLAAYLSEHNVLGIEGIDTRSLTLHLRNKGTMKGVISTVEKSAEALFERVTASPDINTRDLAGEVTSSAFRTWTEPESEPLYSGSLAPRLIRDYHIVVYDFGVKNSILKNLAVRGCRVTIVPHKTPASQVAALNPDGILISNGPGDPKNQSSFIPELQLLLGKIPIFGICFGHQLLAMALGCETYKLRFGHRGANHPVKDLRTGRVQITSQNHGYCVALNQNIEGTEPTHINLNDNTIEGLENKALHCFSVQHHPEVSPGPHDAVHMFDRFMQLIDNFKNGEAGINA